MAAAQTIGPDGFGYVVRGTASANINLNQGSPGVFAIGDGGDDNSYLINLGSRSFRFYDVSYTGVAAFSATANGLLTFGGGTSAFQNSDLTSVPALRAVAVLWDDWTTAEGSGSIILGRFDDTTGDGVADRLVIEWNNLPHVNGPETGNVSFQAILSLNPPPGEQSSIVLQYLDLDAGAAAFNNGASATVGIKDIGTQGPNRLLVSQDSSTNPWVQTGQAILIAIPEPSSLMFLGAGAFALCRRRWSNRNSTRPE